MSEQRTIEEIARDELKGKASDDEAQWLRHPDVIDRWRASLLQFKLQLEDMAERLYVGSDAHRIEAKLDRLLAELGVVP